MLHQPHPANPKLKRCSRLVILPDYQGIGLGTRFLNAVARHYIEQGFDFTIVTSAKNMIGALKRSDDWLCIRYGVSKTSNVPATISAKTRNTCKTASFKFKRHIGNDSASN